MLDKFVEFHVKAMNITGFAMNSLDENMKSEIAIYFFGIGNGSGSSIIQLREIHSECYTKFQLNMAIKFSNV